MKTRLITTLLFLISALSAQAEIRHAKIKVFGMD